MIAWDQRVVHHMRPSSHRNMRIFRMRIRMATGTLGICRCYDPLEVAFANFRFGLVIGSMQEMGLVLISHRGVLGGS